MYQMQLEYPTRMEMTDFDRRFGLEIIVTLKNL